MLGERLRKLRLERKLTQKELGKKVNVTKVSISGYENGIRNPDTETLQALADFFDVSTDYLLGRTEESDWYSKLPELTEKDERDIAKRMKKMKKDLIEGSADGRGLSFMGEPISEEAIESLLEALEHAERIATLANKKYIPRKYRKKD